MPGPADYGFELLASDPGAISPDLALEAALVPVVDSGAPTERPLGKGWSFDFLAGQFIRHGASPAEVYEIDNLRMWVEKTLRTARHAHPIYTNSYGMDEPFRLIGQPVDGARLAAHQQAVVEALTVHDRIAAVDGFYFAHDPQDDGLYVSFRVTLDSPDAATLQVNSLPLRTR